MTGFIYLLIAIVPIVYLSVSIFKMIKAAGKGVSTRKSMKSHLIGLAVVVVLMSCLAFTASAADTNASADAPQTTVTEAAAPQQGGTDRGLVMIAAGLAMGLSGIGGGLAVASGAPAAIAATSENPKSFAKSMIFVALGEAIAIYGLVIAIMIMNS